MWSVSQLLIGAAESTSYDEAKWYLNAIVITAFLPAAFFSIIAMLVFRSWMKANRMGLNVPVVDLIGLKLRRVPIDLILDTLDLAYQHELEITCFDLKYAYLDGIDIRQAVESYIERRKQNEELTFQEILQEIKSGKKE